MKSKVQIYVYIYISVQKCLAKALALEGVIAEYVRLFKNKQLLGGLPDISFINCC